MSDILKKIVESRLCDIEAKTVSIGELQAQYRERSAFRSFHKALLERQDSGKAAIIAEIKRGSPALGLFAPNLNPVSVAEEYERGGAACLSVLTEPHFFHGSMDALVAARNACSLPVLQKDFIVTEYQIYEAALYADAVLLIARCLESAQLKALHDLASKLKLDVLVEVFDEEDIEKIEPFHFPLIGINHRNLKTMDVCLDRSQTLFSRFTADQTVVAASGIKSRQDIENFLQTGIHTFLVGECLSLSPNRIEFLKELVGGRNNVN
jgi:indole-3-glycerol phosphate synthase